MIKRGKPLIAAVALVASCLAQTPRAVSAATPTGFFSSMKTRGAVASKRGGDFVLIDGQCTRLPVMACKMPDGCVALGKVIWNNNVADPLRYHIQAVGVADGAQQCG